MNLLDALYLPAAVATAPWWARKARGGWNERFGRIDELPPAPAGRKRILLHAVSVGEVNTLRSLVPLLAEHADVVVSVTTDTGLARARALFDADQAALGSPPPATVVRYPLDFSPAVKRFLDAVKPDAIGLIELELWPNFVAECGRRGVPVCVINGRLSARSFRGYHRFRSFFARTFSAIEFAAVQDAAYAERFEAMGVRADHIRITGSMKWDSVSLDTHVPGAEALADNLGIDRSRPLIVAGSTGPLPLPKDEKYRVDGPGALTEERLLSASCPPGTQLLCAPRKPERFDEAFAALGGEARCIRRSVTKNAPVPPAAHQHDRFLLDTIGELRAAYSLADIAIVGRSFGDLHGSDPIEPIALGKPTLIGPRFGDFDSIVQTFRAAGAIEVVDAPDLARTLAALLADRPRCAGMAEAGRQCVRKNQGATAIHAQMLLELVGTPE
jgi:3-deoxy-D-manno-octulosonic-acid transferase